jgi:hypothetical protein
VKDRVLKTSEKTRAKAFLQEVENENRGN